MAEKGFELGVKTKLDVDDASSRWSRPAASWPAPGATTSWRWSTSSGCRERSAGAEKTGVRGPGSGVRAPRPPGGGPLRPPSPGTSEEARVPSSESRVLRRGGPCGRPRRAGRCDTPDVAAARRAGLRWLGDNRDVTEPDEVAGRTRLARYAWLSIGAALATIALKVAAYILTGSVGLLSDAVESGRQPRRGRHGPRDADDRGPAGGRGPRLRAQQGRVLRQRRRGAAHPDRGCGHRGDGRRAPVRPPTAGTGRTGPGGVGRRVADQPRGRTGPGAGGDAAATPSPWRPTASTCSPTCGRRSA